MPTASACTLVHGKNFSPRQLWKERGQSKGTCITYQVGYHQESGGRKQGLTSHVTLCLTTGVQALRAKELGMRSEKELRTLSKALDHPLSGNLQGSGAGSKSRVGSWLSHGVDSAVGRLSGRLPEAKSGSDLQRQRTGSCYNSQTQEKASLWEKVRATRQRPTVTLRPAPKTHSSFLITGPEGPAGKQRSS